MHDVVDKNKVKMEIRLCLSRPFHVSMCLSQRHRHRPFDSRLANKVEKTFALLIRLDGRLNGVDDIR